MVKAVQPAVERVKDHDGDHLEDAVQANVLLQTEALRTKSGLLAQAVASGALKIVSGRYDLDKGELTLLG